MEHLEQLRHSGLFDAQVPRYTSYPPVNRFERSEGKLHQGNWLKSVPDGSKLSLYVHIPYCKKLCWFCAYRTQAVENTAVVDKYIDALLQEIQNIRAALPYSITLSRLYLGGGTPTLLGPKRMSQLFNEIYSLFPKDITFECSVEIDANQVDDAILSQLLALGMNRAVMGVQDFSSIVQQAIGREQTFEQALTAICKMRDAGLDSLDMDLIYGLPMQTAETIADTTQQILALEPDRLSVCEYSHVPHLAKRQMMLDTSALPASKETFLLSQVARQILLTDGYESVGIDIFARPGDSLIQARDNDDLKRDFQGYSDNCAWATIGVGASAISRFPQGYVQNVSATSNYCETIKENGLAGDKGYRLTASDHAVAKMIEMLLCHFVIDLTKVEQSFPASVELIHQVVEKIKTGFGASVEISPDNLTLKPQSQPLARLISNHIDRVGSAGRRI